MDKFIALFPGQGSQSVGMGKEFFTETRELFDLADSALGFKLSELMLNGPIEELTLTQNAQPAILTASCAAFFAAKKRPIAALGHSLGEYSALVAAGALDFADAVKLVHKRGQYMQEAVSPGAGKMIAVLGPSVEEITAVVKDVTTGVCEIANLNSPGQTVLAGDVAGIDAAAALFAERGGKVVPLNVSAPFHCSLMKPAADKLAADLRKISFRELAFPVYANFTAAPTTSGEQARENLISQVCGSVRWTESVQNALRESGATVTVEFGSGGVLSNLMKRIDKSISRIEVSTPEGAKNLFAAK